MATFDSGRQRYSMNFYASHQRPLQRRSYTGRPSRPAEGQLDCMSPSTNEATHPRCCDEGYPDEPGRASNKEGESWVIVPKSLSESTRQNRVMQ